MRHPSAGRMRCDNRFCARSFTLVELLIVVGVVVLLAGITLRIGVAVIEQSERRETENILHLLEGAMNAWQVEMGRLPTWGTNGDPPGVTYEMQAETQAVFVISELLDVILKSDDAAAIFKQIDSEYIYQYEAGVYPPWIVTAEQRNELDTRFAGSYTVLDAWGTPIYSLHPGRLWREGVDPAQRRDPDGTFRTDRELDFGVARNRRFCFISAGPSRNFGTMQAYHYQGMDEEKRALKDNIYSYPVDPPPGSGGQSP